MKEVAKAKDLARLADDLRARHSASQPLLLANVWDAASARAVAEAGHPVVATSSAAVAASLGEGDHEQMRPDTAFAALTRIASAVDVPVTADLEAGYRLSPTELAERLIAAGAVGCNLEDTNHHRPGLLIDADVQAERIQQLCQAARAAGVDVVVNARVDVYLQGALPPAERTAEVLRRGRKYLAAGALCIYPIGLTDEEETALLVQQLAAPVNVWLRPSSPPLEVLRRIGVARISLASALHRSSTAHTRRLAADLLAGDTRGLWAT